MPRHLVITALALASLALAAAPTGAQARTHHTHHAHTRHSGPAAASHRYTRHRTARHSGHHRKARHGRSLAHSGRGACDGYHRCRCGVTAAHHAGLPLDYRGFNLKRAVEWVAALPRISGPQVGAVVYQHGGGPSGHVSTIIGLGENRCRATVYDDKGTYERNICSRGAVYLGLHG